jgi:hypothetical protein
MALATTTHYTAITGQTLDEALTARVETLLDLASGVVVAAAGGQAIESATYTDEIIRPWEGIGYFTQRPVTAVTSVSWVVGGAAPLDLTADADYRFQPGGYRRPARLIRVVGGADSYWSNPSTYADPELALTTGESYLLATYTAGYATVPAQIVGLVVALVKNTIDAGGGAGLKAESMGAYSVTYDEALPAGMDLTDRQRAMVEDLTGVDGFNSVPVKAG